ncbi:MAG: VWA domain-containing protein [Pirellulaceae bacterium]|nr:VWA domain-containing protein [Pirellulaceae bacterium]
MTTELTSAMIAFISLTTPLMMLGMGLLVLPVLAHWLSRHARRHIVFPSIELLAASAATHSYWHRLRRWLLLLLRCLTVFWIVWAFARPVWVGPETQPGNLQDRVAAVILLDTSLSTTQQTAGVPLFETMRASAVRAIDELRPGKDVANVVCADAKPDALFSQMSPNLQVVRRELVKLKPTLERSDLTTALSLANDLLFRFSGRRRLIIVSDLQKSAWNEVLAAGQSSVLLPPGTQVTLIAPDPSPPANIGLSDPRCFPPQMTVGQNVSFVVQVSNHSAGNRQIQVSATQNEQPLEPQTVEVEPGQEAEVVFETVVSDMTPLRVKFAVPGDALGADNVAFLSVTPISSISVAVVSDDSPQEPGTGAFFLTRSLEPHGDGQDVMTVRHVPTKELVGNSLRGAAAVFVDYLGVLSETSGRVLVDYLRGGGGLVVFCGEGPVQRNLLALEREANQPFLPWIPAERLDLARHDRFVRIVGGRWQSRLLHEFDEQSQIALGEVAFGKIYQVSQLRPGSQVLLSYDNGMPAMASSALETGTVVLANFSPAITSSEVGKYGSFVALTHMLAKGIGADTDQADAAIVGESYLLSNAIGKATSSGALQLVGPDGSEVEAEYDVQSQTFAVHVGRVPASGFYELRQEVDGNGSNEHNILAVLASNVDSRESVLERFDKQQIVSLFGGTDTQVMAGPSKDWEPMVDVAGRPLWGIALILAMVCMGVELVLLGWWRR